jgi:hypothetical protein
LGDEIMAIDKTKEFWTGDHATDIIEYLKIYSENTVKKTVIVECHKCGSNELLVHLDADEGAIQITCSKCKNKRLLLDSEELWGNCRHKKAKCPICKKDVFNLSIGFVFRDNKDIKWVYLGNRCINCGVLGSFSDWKINYSPTTELENNI